MTTLVRGLGELVVLALDDNNRLGFRAQWSNPGTFDFEVAPAMVSGAGRPIYVSGDEQQVYRIEMQPGTVGQVAPVQMTAASQQIGIISDLVWSETPWFSGLVGVNNGSLVRFGPSALLPNTPALGIAGDGRIPFPQLGAGVLAPPGVAPNVNFRNRVVPLGFELFAVLTNSRLLLVPSSDAVVLFGGINPTPSNPNASIYSALPLARISALHYPNAIAAGDILGFDGVPELIVATQSGQVSYLSMNQLLDTTAFESDWSLSLGELWAGIGTGTFPRFQTTASVVASWGMTWGSQGSAGPIEVIDQCARRWGIDRATGDATYRHMVPYRGLPTATILPIPLPKPIRDLAYVGSLGIPTPIPPQGINVCESGQLNYTLFDYGDALGTLPNRWIQLSTQLDQAYAKSPGPTPSSVVASVVVPDWFDARMDFTVMSQTLDDGFLPFQSGGDVIADVLGIKHAAYWGSGAARNSVVGFNDLLDAYRSTSNNGPATTLLGSNNGTQTHFRNALTNNSDPHSLQSLRLGEWGGNVYAVVGSMGGSLAVLDVDSQISGSSSANWRDPDAYPDPAVGDHGFGGVALCVEPLLGAQADPVIVFGTIYGPVRGSNAVSSLHVYDFDPNAATSSAGLIERSSLTLDGVSGPELFGLCGIAAFDLVADATADGVEQELVLTTLNGDLVVFELSNSQGALSVGAVLYHEVFDGSLGAYNSILYDETSGDLFVASSLGVRKFHVN